MCFAMNDVSLEDTWRQAGCPEGPFLWLGALVVGHCLPLTSGYCCRLFGGGEACPSLASWGPSRHHRASSQGAGSAWCDRLSGPGSRAIGWERRSVEQLGPGQR